MQALSPGVSLQQGRDTMERGCCTYISFWIGTYKHLFWASSCNTGYVSDNISLSLFQSTFVEFFNSPLCSAVCKKLSSPTTFMFSPPPPPSNSWCCMHCDSPHAACPFTPALRSIKASGLKIFAGERHVENDG